MYRKIKKLSLLFAWCFLCFFNSVLAENEIHQIRSNSLANKLQIVVDIENTPSFNAFALSNPPRIVVDIRARAANDYRNNLTFKKRGVTLVRTGMHNADEVRIVLDLKDDYGWRAYHMQADARHGERLVIDVMDTAVNKPVAVTAKTTQGTIALESLHQTQQQTPPKQSATKTTTESQTQVQLATATSAKQLPKTTPPPKKTTTSTDKSKANNQQTTQAVTKVKKTEATVTHKPVPKTTKAQDTVKSTAKATETTAKRLKQKEIVIVIDPGHGGKDSGALGPNGTREKDIVLQIAKRLKRKIDATKGMRAVLTRTTDRYITLRGRLKLARKHKADLFVSIHADAFRNPSASGSSVFILSNRGATSEAARWLAKRENSVDLKYGVDIGDYDKDVSDFLVKIQQDATIESSYILANKTLKQLRGIGKVHKRRVERAGFAVLKSPDVPSMLVETAFISNPAEEKRLKSSRYQDKIASSIAEGIKKYFAEHLPHHLLLVDTPK